MVQPYSAPYAYLRYVATKISAITLTFPTRHGLPSCSSHEVHVEADGNAKGSHYQMLAAGSQIEHSHILLCEILWSVISDSIGEAWTNSTVLSPQKVYWKDEGYRVDLLSGSAVISRHFLDKYASI